MCTAVINLTSKSLNDVTDAEALIKIKTIIALFIQTMEVRCRQPATEGLVPGDLHEADMT